eukprot:Pompholyxophrys_punicea_v1_NODE_140_length_3249_cov_4.736068.p5 type:complete len:121 gc:universal NODE_140_length_3249_cov_4.736068:407-45(-)
MDKFDKRKINELFLAAGMEIPGNWHFLDSLHYCHSLDATKGSFSLKSLFLVYCPDRIFHHHRAENDVHALWQVMVSMTENIHGVNYDTTVAKITQFYVDLIRGKSTPHILNEIPHKYTKI